jgi:hypothetical protein
VRLNEARFILGPPPFRPKRTPTGVLFRLADPPVVAMATLLAFGLTRRVARGIRYSRGS